VLGIRGDGGECKGFGRVRRAVTGNLADRVAGPQEGRYLRRTRRSALWTPTPMNLWPGVQPQPQRSSAKRSEGDYRRAFDLSIKGGISAIRPGLMLAWR